MKHFEVAIIGSGPSGASTAFYLGKQGISTVIIEKEILPRYKACGGGFVNRGRKDMPFDISEVVESKFFTVESYFVNNPNICYKTTKDQPIITMIMRDAFDNLIVEKAKEFGVTLLENHKLLSVNFDGKSSILNTSQGEISANFIIAADGVLSPTAKMCGWTTETRKLIPALEYEVTVSAKDFERLSKSVRFDIDAVPYGYAWCFPKKNHLSLGVLTTKKGKINLKEYYQKYLQTLGIQNIIKEEAHGFQIPISPRTDGFVKNNVFLIGDAAGFAEPITAEGISNAILSGKYVAESLIESKLNGGLAKNIYEEKLQIKLLPELKSGLLLSKIFYNNNPIRNYILNNYGQQFSNIMVDILHGDRAFPKNIRKKLAAIIKEKVS